jgi:SAM-dependent methyltransferase
MDRARNIRICIGIPCYASVSPEVLEDYMRLAFHVGRRLPQYDVALAIKTKSEQFRARNAIVTAALQKGCDYLLMLDDDMVVDWEGSQTDWGDSESKYDFIDTLVEHLQADERLKIVGALYYHRGGDCAPVILKENKNGGLYYIRDDEVENRLQEVAVAGGGCFMIDMDVFSFIESPWFQIENQYGTDIQICQKVRDHGYTVGCDTSIVLGHVLSRREVVTPKNRLRIMLDSGASASAERPQIEPEWIAHSALQLYRADAMDFAGWSTWQEMEDLAIDYQEHREKIRDYEKLEDYYRDIGPSQLARQVVFHFQPNPVVTFDALANLIDVSKPGYGLDFCCGSAPIGFDYVLRGQRMDFVDIDGCFAYEFLKWRAKKREVQDLCGWKLAGPYDYVFLFDAIEHLRDWRDVLGDILGRLRNGGALLTNYFGNMDVNNPEHINMNHEAVKKFIVEHNVYPINTSVWVKKEWGMP